MLGRVISVANSKGGVGKTTTTVSLAEAFAAEGYKTLVVDLDSQANASLLIFGEDGDERLYDAIHAYTNVSDYLRENFLGECFAHMSKFIVPNASDVTYLDQTLDLSLVPATPGLRRAERELIYTLTEQGYSMTAIEGRVGLRLRQDMADLRKQYDIVICDCPPGISAMTEATLSASDLIIVPTIPDFMSTLGLDLFTGDIIDSLKKRGLSNVPIVLATKYDDSNHQKDVLAAMRDGARDPDIEYDMFETVIPNRPEFAANPIELGPRPSFNQKWPGEAMNTINMLYQEVQTRLAAQTKTEVA
ncbi:MAG: AAA family ATPase [Henriciella sp.]|nr:AAA family ATPase [Henriciella sp.]